MSTLSDRGKELLQWVIKKDKSSTQVKYGRPQGPVKALIV